MKGHVVKWFVTLVFTAVLVSCSGPKSTYKEFYQKQSYRKAGVLTDATVLQDAPGKKENFLVERSAELRQTLHRATMAQLAAKGYQASEQYQATGLSLPPEVTAFVSNDKKAKEGASLTGAYSITRSGRKPSKTQVYAAERLFERLLELNLLSNSAKEADFPEVKDLGVSPDQYLVVVSGFSRNVNTSKQVGQALLLAAVSLGTVVAWEPDAALIQVALIDPSTGKIAWANQSPGGGGKKTESVEKDLAKLFKDLPAYGSVKE